MESANNSSPVAKLIPVLIFMSGLIALYYLYQYLFGPNTKTSFSLISKTRSAATTTISPASVNENTGAIITEYNDLPSIVEGGEFSVSTWVYINDWVYRKGYPKSILTMGGTAHDIIRIYIGGNQPKLYVRFHTPGTGNNASDLSTTLPKIFIKSDYDSANAGSGSVSDTPSMCDLPEIPMQRWVNITVAANGKTVDVYLDGKLSRSCVLNESYKVDTQYRAKVAGYGGFGGQISTTTMYDIALNPEEVYKNYMAGPEPILSIGDWFSNTFAPGVSISITSK